MITCKENLIGTRFKIKSRDDAILLEAKCIELGIKKGEWTGCDYNSNVKYGLISKDLGTPHSIKLVFTNKGQCEDTMDEFRDLKMIDINAIKANSLGYKEDYEKVDSFSFALEADFNAGILFRKNEFAGHGYLKCETEDDVAYAASNEMLYRKVIKPIEWWEDLVECIDNTTDGSGYAESIKGEKLHVNASMTRDQWCDFARILLEQGE